jgi:hypothetical protein
MPRTPIKSEVQHAYIFEIGSPLIYLVCSTADKAVLQMDGADA